jgi:hypothetical protein
MAVTSHIAALSIGTSYVLVAQLGQKSNATWTVVGTVVRGRCGLRAAFTRQAAVCEPAWLQLAGRVGSERHVGLGPPHLSSVFPADLQAGAVLLFVVHGWHADVLPERTVIPTDRADDGELAE